MSQMPSNCIQCNRSMGSEPASNLTGFCFECLLLPSMTRMETAPPTTLTVSDPREGETPDLDHLPEVTYP